MNEANKRTAPPRIFNLRGHRVALPCGRCHREPPADFEGSLLDHDWQTFQGAPGMMFCPTCASNYVWNGWRP